MLKVLFFMENVVLNSRNKYKVKTCCIHKAEAKLTTDE